MASTSQVQPRLAFRPESAAGLLFVRNSVDHGTDFDIAAKGVASAISAEEATKAAGEHALLFTPTDH
ncbi:MAG: 4-hydroxythreonine-4-phosphate dehydrogenase PdxA [Chloroflexi bacterium]|nr:4-hydroxythreonine-4-phosphate dehydrogenase PdxA [Chloroflexota bacterium]